MEWKFHIFLLHNFDQKTHTLHHNYGVARLYRDYHIVEVFFYADAKEFHATFNNAFGSIAIVAHYSVGKRAVVYTNSDGCVILLAYIKKRYELFFNLL